MRLLVVLSIFMLPYTRAHADDTCARVSEAMLAWGKAPYFTVSETPYKYGHGEAQGRPDGIYPKKAENKIERGDFSEEMRARAEELMSEDYRCASLDDETIDGKVANVYRILKNSEKEYKNIVFIWKDDGVLHQLRESAGTLTLTFPPTAALSNEIEIPPASAGQSFEAGMRALCDARINCAECRGLSDDEQAVALAKHIEANVKNIAVLRMFKTASIQASEKGAFVTAAAKRAGLDRCDLVDQYEATRAK